MNKYNTPKLQTFHSLVFHARGINLRGCEAHARLKQNVNVRVSGGVYERGADGAQTFDVELVDDVNQPLHVRGYRNPLRNVTCDDVTCFMLHVQRARRGAIKNRRVKERVAG